MLRIKHMYNKKCIKLKVRKIKRVQNKTCVNKKHAYNKNMSIIKVHRI